MVQTGSEVHAMQAHVLRFAVGICAGLISLALVFLTHPLPLAAAIALPVFLLSSLLAERAFRRYATKRRIKSHRDGGDQTPPS
jgi:membrane protein implicated in regulation of membrane protease activity